MDSGNSGSMQSSSGGGDDQDLDSRGESISSFLNAGHNFSAAPPPYPNPNPNFFDPQILHHYSNESSDLIWPNASSIPQPPAAARDPPPNTMKNPKKRTRASRRAPTTVLTTDTTNFRQMVQEFTGIPAPPFSASPYSRRLDLFSADNYHPLGPAPHKFLSLFSVPPQPPLLNSTMIDAVVPTTTIANSDNNLGTASTSINPNSYMRAHQNEPINFANLNALRSDDLSRWRSGETVGLSDGIQQNMLHFDGNNDNSGESQNYGLNLAQKGMENSASTAAQGSVASWICPSE